MINTKWSNINGKWIHRIISSTIYVFLIFTFLLLIPGRAYVYGENAKYIILMISDGWGAKHIEATNMYTGTIPLYQGDPNWTKHWMSTFPDGGSYNTVQAWSDFNYAITSYGDSSACATALYTGFKTANGRVTVSSDGSTAFLSIGERAKAFGKAVGAVSTVNVSHATPGAWVAHNDDRGNTFAIADEGFFGDPNTTGTIATDLKYGGGHGPTIPPVDVLIGAGGSGYVSSQILTKLRNENGQPGKHTLVERQAGADGGDALMAEANNPATNKLAGLFDQVNHNADGSGYNAENPTLSESTRAAIKVLSRNPNGFVLMIEGGAIDWASHANNMNQMIGEQKDYDNAVQTVIDWVDDPANDSDWDNTLVIVTGDHECGYLTKASGVFPNQSLGNVNNSTLAKEKIVSGTGGRRASWEDTDGDNIIDTGETVYWQWNSGNHSNSLIPLYARGAGSQLLADYATRGPDTNRGYYLDNTDVFLVMNSAITGETCTEMGSVSITPGQILSGNPADLTSIVTAANTANINYKVTEAGGCPAQSNESIIAKRDTWKYNGADNGDIGTTWKDTGYDDSGWGTGSGIFGYGETYINTLIGAPGQMSEYFRKTFTICNASAVTSLKFNATYDDGLIVYLNGTRVIAQGVTGNPPVWNAGEVPGAVTGHESNNPSYPAIPVYTEFNLTPYIGQLVSGDNIIAVGIYNMDAISSDLVFDGELVINHNPGDSTLFAGNYIQAQSAGTSGWSSGIKTLEVTADDAVCLTPLPSANGTFTFDDGQTCAETGSIEVTSGGILQGSPVDLTSIVQTSNTANINYKVTETGGCPAQSNESIIAKRDTWKYNGADNGNIGTTWKDTGYDDSGWGTGSGIFGYGETYINTLIGAPGQMSEYFRKTFTICDASSVTSLKFNATYDDGLIVYLNGTRVIAQGVTGNPPVWNAGEVPGAVTGHESNNPSYPAIPVYTEFDLTPYIGQLVSGDNIIAVGIYNMDAISSDLVFDGELVINHNATENILFTGNDTQAQSVDTTGWTDGEKNLEVTGDDTVCLTPLPPANGTFAFYSNVPASLSIAEPDGVNDTVVQGNSYYITYSLSDPDDTVTAAFFYDNDNTGLNGGTISGGCAAAPEGTGITCSWDTSGMTPGSYFVYGIVDEGGEQVSAYSNGKITINNPPGITVNPASGLVTTEAGGTAIFTIKLNSRPTADVIIALRSSDTTEGTVLPASLTFTAANWNIARTVTVTGVNDYIVDGNITYSIVTSAAVSLDSNYNGINAADVSVTNNDNDIAGITVKPTSGLVTTESGGKATFSVVLNTRPKAGVTISLSSSDTTEGKVSPTSLKFTAWNWNVAQKVTVTGVNDFIRDGSQPYTVVTRPAVSTDSSYNSLNAADVSVTNRDND